MIYSINDHKWVDPKANLTTHFTYGELADKLEPVMFMNMAFMRDMVEPLRVGTDVIFRVNSACRSTATNLRVKGHPRSLHLMFNPYHRYTGTLAIDVSSVLGHSETKERFLKLARELGLSIGIHESFYHIDGRVLYGLPRAEFSY